jgi:hypothetical protein
VIEGHDIFWGTALKGVEIFYGEMVILIPSQFEAGGVVCYPLNCRLIKKVVYFLFVDLQVATVNSELLFLKIVLLLDHIKQMVYGTWYQAIIVLHVARGRLRIVIELGQDRHWLPLLVDLVLVPLHGERLAGAGLPIGKDGCVITLKPNH